MRIGTPDYIGIILLFAVFRVQTVGAVESANDPGLGDRVATELDTLGTEYARLQAEQLRAIPPDGGKSILSVDGKKVAEAQVPKTQPFAFSADEGTDVGLDAETNVSPDYQQNANVFTRNIVKVTVEQK